MMENPVRIGAVAYLNAKPLIHDLPELAPSARLMLDVPGRLADLLAEGRLEVALIPAVEYFRHDGYRIVPNIAIASRGPVLSVMLFSRVPPGSIHCVALDVGSRSSAALVQILLRQKYGVRPEMMALPLDQDADRVAADAVLLIGDRAMRAGPAGFSQAYDLGQEWHDWTGLPFVYAFWAVREGVALGAVAAALFEAKRRGLVNTALIAQQQAPLLGLDAGLCKRYLGSIIHFDLGPREQAGLRHYYALACELGLARQGIELEFYHHADLAESR